LKLRPDLVFRERFSTKNRAKLSRDKTASELAKLGFTVNPVETAIYSIYVLELRPLVPEKRRFYVGQTSKPVETRIQEHLSGKHSSRAVKDDFLCRRGDLEPVRKFSSKWDAESEETALGVKLLHSGFDVVGPQGMQGKLMRRPF
jgi:predicted GIY-YIG superfamily endonuclease